MWTHFSGFLSIVLVDLVLSGDNALVIGMACARLPESQRRAGILYGSLAAVLLRVALAAAAAFLLKVPLIRALGGLMLVWIAYRLAAPQAEREHAIEQRESLWDAVRTIAAADLIMSLDNVLAVGGLSRGHLPLLIFGLGLTIPIIMWGSGLVAALLDRAPWLTYAGAAVLAWTAGTMMVEDPWVRLPPGHVTPALAMVLVLGAAVYDRVRRRP